MQNKYQTGKWQNVSLGMEYDIKKFIADLAPRAGWDSETLNALTGAIETGEINEDQAKLLKDAASNLGTVDFFKNDRSGNSLASHFRAEVWDGVTNDTLNSFLENFGDLLDPNEVKLAFSNPKQRFGEKRDAILSAIKEKYDAKLKGLVNSESVNKLISEKDAALQEAREKIKKANEATEQQINALRRQYEVDLIGRDLESLVSGMPLLNAAQKKAATKFLEAELGSRFYLARTENGVEVRSKEDPSLPATDPESKTTVNLTHFAKSVLTENGFLARNNGGGDPPQQPPTPPAREGDETNNGTSNGIAAGSNQAAMFANYERFRPKQ